MKCPYCGSYCADDTLYCPNCKQPLPTSEAAKKRERAARPKVHRPLWQHLITAAVALVSLCAFAVGGYKAWTWIYNYRLERLYTRGAYTPTISQVTMSDLRSGHSIAFFGNDGDQIFLPEMNQSLSISGGVTRLEIADADWFGPDIEGVDYADVTLSPMLISEVGIKTILPKVNFKIDVPQAPLTITSPASDRISVV
ncbi:MAG: zinc ribbon domain-containing protein, partial [bacterium]